MDGGKKKTQALSINKNFKTMKLGILYFFHQQNEYINVYEQ